MKEAMAALHHHAELNQAECEQREQRRSRTSCLTQGVHEDRSCSIPVYNVGVVWVGTTRSLVEGGGHFERIEFKIAALIPDDSKNLTIDYLNRLNYVLRLQKGKDVDSLY
ncbi:4-diphosphocytidyl-2-C-methyl-D-erythritol kinase [Trichinella pseudospiralis]